MRQRIQAETSNLLVPWQARFKGGELPLMPGARWKPLAAQPHGATACELGRHDLAFIYWHLGLAGCH